MQVDPTAQSSKVVEQVRNLDSQMEIDDGIPEVEDDDDDKIQALDGLISFLGDFSVST